MMTELPSFDELKRLAETDSLALETLRLTMSHEVISRAKKERRKKLSIQLHYINQLISSSDNPHQVNIILMNELMKKFSQLTDEINAKTFIQTIPDNVVMIK